MNQESHGAWESALLKTTPIMLMTSLIGKPWPNLPRKGLSKESNVMAFGDWKSDCRSSVEGNAVWRGMQCGGECSVEGDEKAPGRHCKNQGRQQ